MLAFVFFVLTVLLAEGVTAGDNSSRHVTYNVQQLYQACPPPGRVVVNGPSDHVDELTKMKQEMELLRTKVESLQVKIATLEGASNKTSVPAGCAVRNITHSNGSHPTEGRYEDAMAQATCTSMATVGWTFAVKRVCSNSAPDCNAVCNDPALIRQDPRIAGRSSRCIGALHVYNDRPNLNRVYKLGPKIYRYGGCGGNFCGPNFCCCNFR